jgi:hypothetical protein
LLTVYDTYLPITEAWAEGRMRAHGGRVGLSVGAFSGGLAEPLYSTMQASARNNLRIARQAGFVYRDFYANAAPWRGPQFWFDATMRAVGDEWDKVDRTCIDYEIAYPPDYIKDDEMQSFATMLRGLGHPLDGYSGIWFLEIMRRVLGREPRYDLDGYWYADYNGRSEITNQRLQMCDALVGHQHTGTVNVDGVSCDISVFDDSVVVEPKGDELTIEEIEQQLANRAGAVLLTLGNGDVIRATGDYQVYAVETDRSGNRRKRHIENPSAAQIEGIDLLHIREVPPLTVAMLKSGDDITG